MIDGMVRLLRTRSLVALGLVVVTVSAPPGGGRRGRAERLPLRGHRHRPRRRRRAGRDPRRRLVPRADGGRRPHGHRRGLHGRAVPPLPARRHRRAEPPVDRDLPQRRPPGGGRPSPPRSPRRAPTPNRSGRRSPTAAPTPGTTTGCTGWTTRRRASTAASRCRARTTRGACRSSWTARPPRCRGSSSTRSRCPPLPYLGLAVDRGGAARLLRPRPGLRLRRRPAGGGRPSPRSWSAGPTTRRPPTAAGTRCTGRWPPSRS